MRATKSPRILFYVNAWKGLLSTRKSSNYSVAGISKDIFTRWQGWVFGTVAAGSWS